MFVKRTSNPNSGWGVHLIWVRADALTEWRYALEIEGIQHPGAWSRFTLRVGRGRGYYHDWTVQTLAFGDCLCAMWQGQDYFPPPAAKYVRVASPNGIRGFAPFWKLAQGARRKRDGGAAMALVDWLCEKDFGLTELLMEGVPGVREVLAARQAEQFGDADANSVGDERVAPV